MDRGRLDVHSVERADVACVKEQPGLGTRYLNERAGIKDLAEKAITPGLNVAVGADHFPPIGC